jgi:16S rRNA (guanine(966)-N(2))-methyltransferase RsmD
MTRITILAGQAKGRTLSDARGPETRIATAMLRTSLFDILRPRIEGAKLLDLFAGIGALGLEGLSRGAASCVFVERDPRCLQALRKNVQALGYSDRARIVKLDAFETSEGGPYDVVLLDPPYRYFEEDRFRRRLVEFLGAFRPRGIIAAGSLVVVKHGRGKGLPDAGTGLALRETRRYGDTELSFYDA